MAKDLVFLLDTERQLVPQHLRWCSRPSTNPHTAGGCLRRHKLRALMLAEEGRTLYSLSSFCEALILESINCHSSLVKPHFLTNIRSVYSPSYLPRSGTKQKHCFVTS